MTPWWVAGATRATTLARGALGPERALQIARCGSLPAACAQLVGTVYAPAGPRNDDLRADDLAAAQRGVAERLLWQLRVLAGWLPGSGVATVRLVAGAFELANIEGHLRALGGAPATPAYALGSLAAAWPRVGATSSPAAAREALRTSPWGDPGPGPLAQQLATLRWGLAVRAARAFAPCPVWARTAAGLLLARQRFAHDLPLTPPALRHARMLLPRAAVEAPDLPAFAVAAASAGLTALADVREPRDLWRAEARWWTGLDGDGRRLLTARGGSDVVLGAVAVLSVDAWRLRAALLSAASGGRGVEVLTGEPADAPE